MVTKTAWNLWSERKTLDFWLIVLSILGEAFLPAPTYNPKRRVIRPPPQSYITEPTALRNYPITSPSIISPIDRKIDNVLLSHADCAKTDAILDRNLKTRTYLEPIRNSDLPNLRPVQRAVSLGNLVQTTKADITNKWDNMWDLAPTGLYSPTGDPLDESDQICANRRVQFAECCATLTHPHKTGAANKSEFVASLIIHF